MRFMRAKIEIADAHLLKTQCFGPLPNRLLEVFEVEVVKVEYHTLGP